jgi:glucose/arabinose dehydrogenase
LIVEQNGKIIRVRKSGSGGRHTTVLNLGSKILPGSERGLLGLTLHPQFESNGYMFVNYTRDPDGATVISRFTVNRSTWKASAASELQILTVSQPYSNHNAGSLTFGNDGLLYIPLGDGGGSGDPDGNAQSLRSLLGKILRIDVNRATRAAPYSIPPSNPFASGANGARPEIYALGLRNPFKVTRDKDSGQIWIADVGQNAREEIDLLFPKANYGWNIVEGDLCYPSLEPCAPRRFRKPIYTIPHPTAESVTGGYVYRGSAIPTLRGRYIYGDFITGKIWSLRRVGQQYRNSTLLASNRNISSFGQDTRGEIYVVDYGGAILKLTQSLPK